MSLRLLLDENMSQVVAAQVRRHRPAVTVESVHTWRGGAFEGHPDRGLLDAATAEGLTPVTDDQATIPPLPAELYAEGGRHAGVVFVDDETIPNNDSGTLTRALILLWERFGNEDWQDRIRFSEEPAR